MTGWDPAATALLSLLAVTARGPKRGGLFALWLTIRVAQDLLFDSPSLDRAQRRRLQALERRLSSLTMPPPLRRALVAALGQMRELRPDSVPQILNQLIAPAKETEGAEAAEAVALAARQAKQVLSSEGRKRASGEAGK
jgi:hypothetical protein